MNHVLKPHKNTFVHIYLGDVLILSNSRDEHLQQLDLALDLFAQNDIRLRILPCFFGITELEYLSHMVNKIGLHPIDNKVQAVRDWARPRTVKQRQHFLGLYNLFATAAIYTAMRTWPLPWLI